MMRRRVLPVVAAALLAGGLVNCRAPPPPLPAPPPLPVPPAFVPPPASTVVGRWSFEVTPSGCVANASNRDVSLRVHVGRNNSVELNVAGRRVRVRGGRRARLRFDGAAGSWTLPARSSTHRAVVAIVRMSETTADRVLMLLGGGRLRTEVGTTSVPVLRLPDSDVAGREWFDCVRGELKQATPGS